MKGFKLQPVAWLTTISGILLLATGATRVPPFDHVHWIAASTPWLAGSGTIAAMILGYVVHGIVTPLEAPKDDAGNPLVPANVTVKPRGPMRPMGG